MLGNFNNILAVDLGLKSTDYFIIVGMGYFIIKELLKLLNKKDDKKDEASLENRRQQAEQHSKNIELQSQQITILNGIAAVTKSTNEKCEGMKESIILIKARVCDQ